jgi:hypothetical protein
LVVWLLTAAGGTALYLRLLRRAGDDDEWHGGLVLASAAVAAAPAALAPAGPEGPGPIVTIPTQVPPLVMAPTSAVAARVFEKKPAKGVERTTIGYHKVRISSEPDDLRSAELGRLDRGDEVEIVGSHEGFLQVRTPDATVGWIPRHVIVGAPKGSQPD